MQASIRILSTLISGFLAWGAAAQDAGQVPDLNLEDLINIDVTSASRKTQHLQEVAAAVFVITQEDIARSGARSLADVLAMAPGVEVARIGNNRWAVSARGWNSRFASKLQVLKDGRSVYSPLFSGVFWEAEYTVLEDIERIEIIRGPNAAMWGSNAVNGTINIITKKARDTQGGLVAVRAGTVDKGNVSARYGFAAGDNGHLRLYAKGGATRGGYASDDSRAGDKGDSGMVGFRGDWLLSSGNRLFVNGETYRYHNTDTYAFPDPLAAPSYVTRFDWTMAITGGHLQGRFESLNDDGSELSIQSYLAHREMDVGNLMKEKRTTADVDVQYRLAPKGAHDLMIGANYRNSRDEIHSASSYVGFKGNRNDFQLASIFANDEITVIPDRLKATFGVRLEHNNYSGTALQPTARFLWTPTSEQAIWGALSSATRTPSRADRDASIYSQVLPPVPPFVPFPTLVRYVGAQGPKPDAEKMNALELGYRHRFGQSLSLDATAFVHRYRDGLVVTPRAVDLTTLPLYVTQPIATTNGQRTTISGMELSLIAQILPSWRLLPSYTWMHANSRGLGDPVSEASAANDEKKVPHHMVSLRSQHNLGQAQQLDFWLKYKSRNEALGIPDRANLDVRYAWRANRSTELSVVGQSLLHKHAVEYLSDQLPSVPVEVGRSAYLRVDYRF